MQRGKSILRLILICVFTGCIGASVVAYSVYQRLQRGWNNTPLPTMRAFSGKDIVGTWTYSDPRGLAVATITFNQDGTFDQQVSLGGATPTQQKGQWSIPSGTDSLFKVLYQER